MSDRGPSGWLFLEPSAVPERWRDRSVPAAMVPLTPEETDDLLRGDPVEPRLHPADEELARLAAQGLTVDAIAGRMGVTPRSVYRRLSQLREQLGVGSTAELATELARRGFQRSQAEGQEQ